jgi:hypothetical protein
MSRLTAPVSKKDKEMWVETGLDWVAGDRIAIAPTSFEYLASEENFIKTYDPETGFITLEEKIQFYQWGGDASIADNYNGADLRAEVILLNRNVKIQSIMEEYRRLGVMITESWGGTILTSDVMEFTEDMELRTIYGTTYMDNVEIYNCSQMDSYDAALNWDGASLESVVSNSSLHNGMGWGVNIQNSKNVIFDNNTFYNFRPIGLGVDYSENITITNNVMIRIMERDTIEAFRTYVDRKGGYCICSVYDSSASCKDIVVNHNIAAGITMAGFWALAQNCDEENTKFYGNVAHSIAGTNEGGNGVIFNKDNSEIK